MQYTDQPSYELHIPNIGHLSQVPGCIATIIGKNETKFSVGKITVEAHPVFVYVDSCFHNGLSVKLSYNKSCGPKLSLNCTHAIAIDLAQEYSCDIPFDEIREIRRVAICVRKSDGI